MSDAKPAAQLPAVASPKNLAPVSAASNSDDHLWRLAERIKNSSIVPKDYIGKQENIFVAMLYGREIGLHPMQAVQSIMVVNGRPSMWGDAVPGLVFASGLLEKFEESFDNSTMTATCIVRRKGDTKDHVQTFSLAEAQKAGLTNKDTWKNWSKRMCQMRARAFAMRDRFADVLKGLLIREEVEDYQILEPAREPVREPEAVPPVVIEAQAESVPTNGDAPARDVPPAAETTPKETDRLLQAAANFEKSFGVSPAAVKAWAEWKKFSSAKEQLTEMSKVWLKGKANVATIRAEFDRFEPKKETPPPTEDTLFS